MSLSVPMIEDRDFMAIDEEIVPSAVPQSHTLAGILHRLANEAGAALALQELDGGAVTFAEFRALVEQEASRLPRGARRVGVGLGNDISSAARLFAAWSTGASVVALSGTLPDPEIQRRVEESRCDAVIGREGILSAAPGTAPVEDDEAIVIFTSGTTGRPKGTVLTFSGLARSLSGISRGSGLDGELRLPAVPPRRPVPLFTPLSHMAGAIGLLSGLYLGKPVLLVPKFDAAVALRLIDEFQVSNLKLTPTMVYDLWQWPQERTLGSVRSVTVGSAALPAATRHGFEERYGVPVLQNYGQTEFAGAIAFERYSDVVAGRRPTGTVGRVAPGVEVRIVGSDGQQCPPGDVGEIHARGGGAMKGYLGPDGRAMVSTDRGWVATGDLGTLDEDGFLSILGRVRDVVNVGGFNVYPAVVEAAVNKLPGVADSAVSGLPEPRLGEVPVVAIVAQDEPPSLEAIREQLRTDLAPYELPRRLLVLDALPRTANGKIDRPAVTRLAAERENQ
jgi:acyl-CoA synthetase (AMP-forming)/AMP-acid ligase II